MPKRKESPGDWKIRTSPRLHAALKGAADKHGVSLNAEAVERLEWTVGLEKRLGGSLAVQIAENIVLRMADAGVRAARVIDLFEGNAKPKHAAGDNWILHPYAFDVAVKAVMHSLEAQRPAGKIVPPQVEFSPNVPAADIFARLNARLRAGEDVGEAGIAAAAGELEALKRKGQTDE